MNTKPKNRPWESLTRVNVTEEERQQWRTEDTQRSREAEIQVLIYEETHRGHGWKRISGRWREPYSPDPWSTP